MVVGKDFVILSMPKTGTVFRRWVADQYTHRRLCPAWCKRMKVVSNFLHSSAKVGSQWSRSYRKNFLVGYFVKMGIYKILLSLNHCPEQLYIHRNPHGTVKQIHKLYALRGKEVLSVIRNPHSQIVSRYQYQQTKHKGKFEEKVGNFEAYIRYFLCDRVFCFVRDGQGVKLDYPLGILSYYFINMYFKDSVKILSMSAEEFDEYCVSDDYKKDMYPVKFFRLETHNKQLCEYLKSKPYLDSQIIDEIFNEAKPKNVSKKREDVVWDKETKAYFEKTEKFYIRMVKELAPLPEDDF